jgi:tetratricopeptide (TPR) repeat protein
MKKSLQRQLLAISLLVLWPGFSTAQNRLDAAGQAFNRGDYRQAIRLFENLRASSSDCDISYYLGLSHYRLKELDDAIVDLAIAASCQPKSVGFNTALAEAYIQKGDDNRALTTLQTILQLDPKNIAALSSASTLYLRHDMSDDALPILERLVSLDSTNTQATTDLAAAYAAHGQTAQAQSLYERAIALDPRNSSALAGLGNLEFKNDQDEQAVHHLSRAIQLDNHTFEPFVSRARAYSRLKKFPLALADYQVALRLSPNDADIYYYLSQTYRSMGRAADAQEALEHFKALRNQNQQNTESQREAARLTLEARRLVEAGDVPNAVSALEKARGMDEHNAPVLFRLAGLYFEIHQYARANASIQEAIQLVPSQWDYHYLKGLIEIGEDHFDLAEQSLQTAVLLNPSSAEIHNQLGELALRRKDVDHAVKEFARAVELAPAEQLYRTNLEHADSLSVPK